MKSFSIKNKKETVNRKRTFLSLSYEVILPSSFSIINSNALALLCQPTRVGLGTEKKD